MISGEGLGNDLQHALDILIHFIIPKPQHPPTRLFKRCRADSIAPQVRGFVMLPTIKLNHKFLFFADEIKEVMLKWLLTAKFKAKQLAVA
jgi:hypothetical protein